MNGAFRASVLGRQSTTMTTAGAPMRRLAAQGFRTQPARATPAPPRAAGGQSVATGARTSGTGRTTLLRGPSAAAASRTVQGLSQRSQKRTFNWTWSRRSGGGKGSGAEAEPQSLSARLRKLSREYGWAALGVYLGLSVLDFPFCFLLVRMVGTDRIAEVEHWVMAGIKKVVPESVKQRWYEYRAAFKDAEKEELGDNHVSEDIEKVGWGVEKAQERHKEEASKSHTNFPRISAFLSQPPVGPLYGLSYEVDIDLPAVSSLFCPTYDWAGFGGEVEPSGHHIQVVSPYSRLHFPRREWAQQIELAASEVRERFGCFAKYKVLQLTRT